MVALSPAAVVYDVASRTALRLGPLTRFGASTTTAHIRFDDHPNSKRFSDRIETVTVDSVLDWLERSGLGSAPQRVAW